jgi:hypothetical protein
MREIFLGLINYVVYRNDEREIIWKKVVVIYIKVVR